MYILQVKTWYKRVKLRYILSPKILALTTKLNKLVVVSNNYKNIKFE